MPPTVPPRTGDDIPVVNTTPFRLATRAWQLVPGRDSLVVIVKGSFDIVLGGPATARDESEFPTGQFHVEDDPAKSCITPNDFAIIKPRAEVFLLGHAHAPGGHALSSRVALRFGDGRQRIDKTIAVQGNRRWQTGIGGSSPSAPEPFRTVPLTYERAFGGPDYPANPWGVGHGASPVLPNLELPNRLITSKGDAPAPACFAPLSLEMAARWAKLGTYDRRWFTERWPYFAADFDATFFQDAPADQQLDQIVGNEPFAIDGVHPELSTVQGSLPSERARVFLVPRPEHGSELVPVPLRLDTVVLDCDAMALHLTWRGAIDVRGSDAPEVQALFLMRESLAEATPREQIRARFLAAITEVAPENEVEDDEATELEPPPPADPMDAEETQIKQRLAALGVEEPLADDASPATEPSAAVEALRAAGAEPQDILDLQAAMAQQAPAPEQPPEPPLRELVLGRYGRGESLAELNLSGADLSDLDLCNADFSRADLTRARLARCKLDHARFVETQLGEADLEGSSLVGAELTSADLTSARLDTARLDEATLDGAELAQASARATSFARARGEQASFADGDFEGANFEAAVLTAADFSRASIEGARFDRAELPKLRLYDARAKNAVFDGAIMPNTRAEGAYLYAASFVAVHAEDSVFENIKADRAAWRDALLSHSSFVRAVCRKADFSRVELQQGRLARADFAGAIFERANLMMSDLEAADLTVADLRGANLHGTNLWHTTLTDAKLDSTILTQSTFSKRGG